MKRPDRLEDLTVRLSPSLLAYFARRVEPREDAADLLNETLIVAWRKIRSVPNEENEERAWLFGVAARVLSNHRRSAIRRGHLVQKVRDDLEAPREPSQFVDLARDVALAMAKLNATDRELVRLIHWDGLSASEAGRVLVMPESTARARYAAVREDLRNNLSDLADQTARD